MSNREPILSKREVIRTMVQLATTAFGVVAALAWNDAVIALFRELFGEQSTVLSRFLYAIIVTIAVVLVTHWLGRAAQRAENANPPK